MVREGSAGCKDRGRGRACAGLRGERRVTWTLQTRVGKTACGSHRRTCMVGTVLSCHLDCRCWGKRIHEAMGTRAARRPWISRTTAHASARPVHEATRCASFTSPP